jgi:hypothetical protein
MLLEASEAMGFAKKTSILEATWKQTATPEDWAILRLSVDKTAEADPRHLAVINACEQSSGGGFTHVFRAACQQSAEPAALFCGLFLWVTSGGKPQFQGRNDLALHFICGGLGEVLMHNGIELAVLKECRDYQDGKPFDLDDMAATLAGALWVEQARNNRNWLAAWADGTHTLDDTFAPFHYGSARPSDTDRLQEVFTHIAEAYGLSSE